MATAVRDVTAASQEIDVMCSKALKALEVMKTFNQEQVDKITKAMCEAGVANERYLAEFAVEETGIGKVEDKVIKNHFGSQVVYDYMKDQKSVGVIGEKDGIIEIAEPLAWWLPSPRPPTRPRPQCSRR